jgi:hypothetical protein
VAAIVKKRKLSSEKRSAKSVKHLPRTLNLLELRKRNDAYEDGLYRVDSYAELLFPFADRAMAVKAVRSEVNRAAKVAVVREHRERNELRESRDRAKRLIKLLDKFDRESAWLAAGDVAVVASEIAQGFSIKKNTGSIATPLVQILESVSYLRMWLAELHQFDIAPSPPSNSDPLARAFVEVMAAAFMALTGSQPPHSRQGPFVNLIAAAWLDLSFPWPSPETSVENWLGQKVESILTTKKPRQTR